MPRESRCSCSHVWHRLKPHLLLIDIRFTGPGDVRLVPHGDVGQQNAALLQAAFAEVVLSRPDDVVVDLGRVRFLDGSGPAAIEWLRETLDPQTSLVIDSLPKRPPSGARVSPVTGSSGLSGWPGVAERRPGANGLADLPRTSA